jgi:uncharacterized protein (DUF1697 family)
MIRYVAFLRAINVAGHAIVKMTDLRDAFAEAGCKNVRTYIQTGNVIFDASEKTAPSLFRKLHVKVRALVGEEPVIVFRTAQELERILKSDPFKGLNRDKHLKLYVTFLREEPKVTPTLPFVSAKDAIEAIGMNNLDLFLVSRPIGPRRYGFPNLPIEKQFRVAATSRNWNTLAKIVALATT